MIEQPENLNWDKKDWLALALIAAFGAIIRFAGLDSLPPALWFDEGLNGFDALNVGGENGWPLIFTGVFPREPLLVYLISPFVTIFGSEIYAVRLAPALIGALAPPLLYLWLRQATTRQVALLAAIFLAGMRWHVHFSRIAFRTIWTPTLALAFLGLFWLALRTGRKRWAAASGVAFALGFYAYLSWYFFVPAAALVVALALFGKKARQECRAYKTKGRRAGLAIAFCATVLLTVAPIWCHYLTTPSDITGRTSEISLFKDGMGPAMAAIGKNASEASVMIFWKGDHVSKHNIPWKPALEPLGAALFLIGCFWAVRRIHKSSLAAFLLAWIVFGTLPTVFSYTDSPNFLRTLIITPAIAALAGLGAGQISERLSRWKNCPRPIRIIPTAWVCASVVSMLLMYFAVWPQSPRLWQDFSGEITDLAQFSQHAGEDCDVYVPGEIMGHYSFQYLTFGGKTIHAFSISEAVGPGANADADHIIVESPYINPIAAQALALGIPRARLEKGFAVPGSGEPGGFWARAWRLPPSMRMSAQDASQLEQELAK